jgi:hypothetical protein
MFSLILFALFSCQTTRVTKISRAEVFNNVDFTKYTQNKFLITPEKYSGPYESIGLIDFIYMPGAELKANVLDEKYITSQQQNTVTGYTWDIEQINIQDVIDGIYNRCIDMGANALINFSVATQEQSYQYIQNPVNLYGYRITGFAIKTK